MSDLLSAAPQLKVLVTSRAALQVRGEHEYAVPPLALPDRQQTIGPAALSQYGAMALFVERAAAIKGDFTVTNENAPAIAAICHRLDGLPLAIELAAARTRLLTPQAILARLERRLPLLTGGARDLPARQQTLRNAIAWSYDLLSPEEQTLYRRLSIFVGGCTLEAAEAVCDPDGALGIDMLDGVTSLAAQNLIRQEDGPDGEPRFGMLEMIREYGLERLDASSEAMEMRRRHAEYFIGLAERAEPELHRPDQIAWVERLAAEHDNFLAALTWTLGAGNDPMTAARLGAALGWFWFVRGLMSETRWLEAVLAATAEPTTAVEVIRARAKCLRHLGWMGRSWNDPPRTVALAEKSLALFRAVGDRPAIAYTLTVLGMLLRDLRDYPRAHAAAEEGIALGREVGEPRATAHGLYVLASILWYESYVPVPASPTEERSPGDRAGEHREREVSEASPGQRQALFDMPSTPGNRRAIELLEESAALCRCIGDLWGMGIALIGGGGLTVNCLIAGDYARATEACRESIRLYWRMRDLGQVAVALRNFGHIALCKGEPRRAAYLIAAFRRVYEAIWTNVTRYVWPATEHEVAVLRSWLSEEELKTAWAEGQAMSMEQAVAYALEEPPGT